MSIEENWDDDVGETKPDILEFRVKEELEDIEKSLDDLFNKLGFFILILGGGFDIIPVLFPKSFIPLILVPTAVVGAVIDTLLIVIFIDGVVVVVMDVVVNGG